jgi:hypothetical protein
MAIKGTKECQKSRNGTKSPGVGKQPFTATEMAAGAICWGRTGADSRPLSPVRKVHTPASLPSERRLQLMVRLQSRGSALRTMGGEPNHLLEIPTACQSRLATSALNNSKSRPIVRSAVKCRGDTPPPAHEGDRRCGGHQRNRNTDIAHDISSPRRSAQPFSTAPSLSGQLGGRKMETGRT